jgi:hypothetical protein
MDIRQIAQDPDFQKLPIEEQRKAFSENDKDFASLPATEQDKGISELIKSTTQDTNTGLKKFAKGAIETLPYVGAAVGGALTSPGIVTTAAGAGLGYLAGEYAKKGILGLTGLEEQPPMSTKDLATRDIPEAAIVGMSGGIGEKAIGMTLRSAGKIIKPVLGKLQGTGTGAETEAIASGIKTGLSSNPLKSQTSFDKALRGEMPGEEIVGNVKSALSTIKEKRSLAYVSELDKIKADPSKLEGVSSNLNSKLDNLASPDKFDLGIVKDAEGKVNIDFSKSTIVEHQNVVSRAIEDVANWTDNTPKGLDQLKKRLGTYISQAGDGTPAQKLVTQLKTQLSDDLNATVPGYKDMTRGYEKASNLIQDIESTLTSKKQGRVMADSTLRKLTLSMKNDREIAKDLLDTLGNQGAEDLSGQVAGFAMRSPVPLGLSGTGPALIGEAALAIFNPKFWPVLVASSPRASAEFLRMYGKVAVEMGGTALTTAQIATIGAMNIKNKADIKNKPPVHLLDDMPNQPTDELFKGLRNTKNKIK